MPVLIWIIWIGGLPLTAVVAVIGSIGLLEYASMWSARGVNIPIPTSLLALGGIIGWTVAPGIVPIGALVTAIVLGFLAWQVFGHHTYNSQDALLGLAGVFYVGWLLAHLVLLRGLPSLPGREALTGGFGLALFAWLITWTNDTAAFLVGTTLGRHRLAPRLSPAKSVEGALAGLVFSGVAAGLLSGVIGRGLLASVIVGLVLSVAGQIGDLSESALKRHAGVKDSGAIIPGHGGVLDRFDSAFFTVPLLYYIAVLSPWF
jgi:phosphatidate cytidylyltransferase